MRPPVSRQRWIDGDPEWARRLRDHRILTAAEESELGLRIQAGDASTELAVEFAGARRLHPDDRARLAEAAADRAEARDTFIRHNQRLVVQVALATADTLPLEDRVQAGNLGLLQAAEKFDPGQGSKFSTYAVWWIRQAIDRAIANESRVIRLPVHVHDRVETLRRAERRLRRDGRSSDAELCAELGWSADELTKVRAVVAEHLSWESELSDPAAAEWLPERPDDGDAVLDEAALQRFVADVRTHLDDRSFQVLCLRNGLVDGDPQTLDQIGQRFGVTRERIRQIEKKAVTLLRERLPQPT
ncbi:sigma-70 family RNA polymerase sigma factor [Enemella dayhoffiae]|nr:sigma-70 family RNA polymerase sigma factor [Enemella dayhoffiae]